MNPRKLLDTAGYNNMLQKVDRERLFGKMIRHGLRMI